MFNSGITFAIAFSFMQSTIFDQTTHKFGSNTFVIFLAGFFVWRSFSALRDLFSDYRPGEQPIVAQFAYIFIRLALGFAAGSSIFHLFTASEIMKWFS